LSTTLSTGMTGISLHLAMASDFTVTWQYSQRKQLVFFTDQTPRPYPTRGFPAQRWSTFLCWIHF
jgi:hypothetical protein